MRRALLILALLGLDGCAHSQVEKGASAGEEGRRRLELPPVVVRATPDDVTGLSSYDAQTLFHLAGEAVRNEKPDVARTLYARLVAEFPDSELVTASRWNLGGLFEQAQLFGEAASAYRAIADSAEPAGEQARIWLDANYRLAVCLGELNQWWDAVAIFDRLLEMNSLSRFDRLQAMVGRGIAVREAGDLESAEVALLHALRFFEEARDRDPIADQGLAAEAAFHLGEIAAQKYATVVLAYPVETLRERLTTKCELLLSAQHRFLKAIRYGDAHAVAAAGFRIGSLYESLYDQIIGLEIPPELSTEQAEVYQEEVRDRVGILVKKAIMVYERTLQVGRTAPTAEAWVARIEQALERLRSIYLGKAGGSEPTAAQSSGAGDGRVDP